MLVKLRQGLRNRQSRWSKSATRHGWFASASKAAQLLREGDGEEEEREGAQAPNVMIVLVSEE